MTFDEATLDKTLQELEDSDWGDPGDTYNLIVKCHRLRRIPLRDFNVERLRLMIGQNIGSKYLIPMALDVLEIDPWVAGDFVDGDLLSSVQRSNIGLWNDNPDLKLRMDRVVEKAKRLVKNLSDEDIIFYDKKIFDNLDTWE